MTLQNLTEEMFAIQADLQNATKTYNEMKQEILPVEHAKKVLENNLQEVKDQIETYIKEENGGASETLNGFKYGLRKLPTHVVMTEGAIVPEHFLVVKTQPNKKAIKDALKDGELDFATMSSVEYKLDIKADI